MRLVHRYTVLLVYRVSCFKVFVYRFVISPFVKLCATSRGVYLFDFVFGRVRIRTSASYRDRLSSTVPRPLLLRYRSMRLWATYLEASVADKTLLTSRRSRQQTKPSLRRLNRMSVHLRLTWVVDRWIVEILLLSFKFIIIIIIIIITM